MQKILYKSKERELLVFFTDIDGTFDKRSHKNLENIVNQFKSIQKKEDTDYRRPHTRQVHMG